MQLMHVLPTISRNHQAVHVLCRQACSTVEHPAPPCGCLTAPLLILLGRASASYIGVLAVSSTTPQIS